MTISYSPQMKSLIHLMLLFLVWKETKSETVSQSELLGTVSSYVVAMAESKDGSSNAYISIHEGGDAGIWKIDLSTGNLIGSKINPGFSSQWGVAALDDNTHIMVADRGNHQLRKLSIVTGQIVQSWGCSTCYNVEEGSGGFLWVMEWSGGQCSLKYLNPSTSAKTTHLTFSSAHGCRGMGITPDRRYILVSDSDAGEVHVWDSLTNSEVATPSGMGYLWNIGASNTHFWAGSNSGLFQVSIGDWVIQQVTNLPVGGSVYDTVYDGSYFYSWFHDDLYKMTLGSWPVKVDTTSTSTPEPTSTTSTPEPTTTTSTPEPTSTTTSSSPEPTTTTPAPEPCRVIVPVKDLFPTAPDVSSPRTMVYTLLIPLMYMREDERQSFFNLMEEKCIVSQINFTYSCWNVGSVSNPVEECFGGPGTC